MESALGSFVNACNKVESVLQRFFAPFADELQIIGRDLKPRQRPEATRVRPANQSLARRLSSQNLRQIFGGSERKRLLDELEDAGTQKENPEEKEASTQLIVGAATVAMSLAARFFAPGLYLVWLGGIVYQARFLLSQAYQGVVREERINIYALNTVMLAGATLTRSYSALTLGIFSASFLRWIIAKTDSAAQQSVADAFSRHPRSVWIVVDGTELQVPFEKLHVGDIILVNAGEMIPVDGVITGGLASVDQHMLTGESQLVEKSPGDGVLASSMLLRGKIYVRVQHSGDDTVSAQVVKALADTRNYKHELRARTERQLDRLAIPMLGVSAVTLALRGSDGALATLWGIPGYRMMFLAPITMLNFMHILARNGVLIKNGQALERLQEVDTVVLDKTGTLTLGQPKAGRVFRFAGLTEDEVLGLAAAAEHRQDHPIATAILQLAQHRQIHPPAMQESQVTVGFGVQVEVDGHKILVGSERLMAMSQIAFTAAAAQHQAAVHALGNSLIFIARDAELVGAVEICAQLRPGAEGLIAALQQRGQQVIIISGDEEAPTKNLAAQLGISRYFAQTLPTDKAKLIEGLQKEGRVVCFVGDGINDSIALQRADVSVSLKGATSIATTVAQVVLMNDTLDQLIVLFELADRFEDYMRVNRLSTNIPAFVVLGGTLVFGWGLFTAVLINQISVLIAFYNLTKPATEFLAPESIAPVPEQRGLVRQVAAD